MPARLTRTMRALGALVVVAGLVAGVAPAPAGAQADPNGVVIDLTFPAERTGRYSDDYTAPRSGGRTHCATDILGTKHSGIYAAVAGTITFMPTVKPSYGYLINLQGVDGRKYSYVHLNDDNPGTDDDRGGPHLAYAPGLQVGSRVARGQHIGYLGDSGNAKGTPHLHFEIHDPAVSNPVCATGGITRLNPFRSVDAARRRGDFGGAVRSPATPPAGGASIVPRTVDRACPAGRVTRAGFADVAGTHRAAVDCLHWWDVAEGRSATSFAPAGSVNRAQLASFVERLAAAAGRPLPAAGRDHFDDDAGSVHEDAINRVASAGIMGSADRRFSPNLAVTRGSMATVVAGTYRQLTGTVLPAGTTTAFSDVGGHTHAANIGRVAALRVAAGYGDGSFRPGTNVSREQMATFLARLLDALVERGTTTPPR